MTDDISGLLIGKARSDVAEYARRMVRDGLAVGTSGNVSVRVGDLVAVTPSGVGYEQIASADVCVVDLDGSVVDSRFVPTSELPLHLACYQRHGAGAVVHTHSPAATALSLLRDDVPFVHYQIAMFGGSVGVAPYAPFGSLELVENVSAALDARTAAVMKHHGTVSLGSHLEKAYDGARQLEWLCDVWLRASAVAPPALLSADQIEEAVALMAGYGQ